MKKTKKTSLIIVSIATPIALLIACFGGFAAYLMWTKSFCGNYAREKSMTADSPDYANAVLYDQCLKDKGLAGF